MQDQGDRIAADSIGWILEESLRFGDEPGPDICDEAQSFSGWVQQDSPLVFSVASASDQAAILEAVGADRDGALGQAGDFGDGAGVDGATADRELENVVAAPSQLSIAEDDAFQFPADQVAGPAQRGDAAQCGWCVGGFWDMVRVVAGRHVELRPA
ncbi:hypothetical protein Q0Z83_110440 [Actinoplanes sichuanensis]|nr:hypothetical protein Q0Z83_110440 [Actinoplanes sichuanensis]